MRGSWIDRQRVVDAAPRELQRPAPDHAHERAQLLVRERDEMNRPRSPRLGPRAHVLGRREVDLLTVRPAPVRGDLVALGDEVDRQADPVAEVEAAPPACVVHTLDPVFQRPAVRPAKLDRYVALERQPFGGRALGKRAEPHRGHGHFELVPVAVVQHRHVTAARRGREPV